MQYHIRTNAHTIVYTLLYIDQNCNSNIWSPQFVKSKRCADTFESIAA